MIARPSWFIAGLLVGAVGAAVRYNPAHGAFLPDVLRHHPQVWGLVAAACFAVGLLWRKRPDPADRIVRRAFSPLPLRALPKYLETLCSQPDPDIPLIVDFVVYQAIHGSASDIHFDPGEGDIAVRFRHEGMMVDVGRIPRALGQRVTNRLKVLSNLVIYREALPQDGRFARTQDHPRGDAAALQRSGLHGTDFRIAFMPTLYGERIVIRILGNKETSADLGALGLSPEDRDLLEDLISRPQGMIVLTGPTGSGKTTTIFALINHILRLSHNKRSVATLEDPVEFEVPGINQSQVDEEKGFTFQHGLRAILRQDPDVIMVGEIRDKETAQIALQAGMTGHLLITTVHASSSAATFARLLEMGVPAYSLTAAVTAVIGQRLVRKLCPHCRVERRAGEEERRRFGDALPPEFPVYTSTGCSACDGSGYSGRTALFEILVVTEEIRRLVSAGGDASAIAQAARNNGMRTLWDVGLAAAKNGVTSLDEVYRTVVKMGA